MTRRNRWPTLYLTADEIQDYIVHLDHLLGTHPEVSPRHKLIHLLGCLDGTLNQARYLERQEAE